MADLQELVAAPQYQLTVPCMACNREAGQIACGLCCKIEYAERSVNGEASPQMVETCRAT